MIIFEASSNARADKYRSFEVVVTVRSEEKGRRILDAHPRAKLSFVIVEDVAKDGAFDEVSLVAARYFLLAGRNHSFTVSSTPQCVLIDNVNIGRKIRSAL